MNWDAIAAIGQVVGTVLVGIPLVYLAIQLRQNTSALKSSTFLAVSTRMGSNREIFATQADLAPLFVKAQTGLDALSAAERVRFGFLMMMAFRNVETVAVQRHLGAIDPGADPGLRTLGDVGPARARYASIVGDREGRIQRSFLGMGQEIGELRRGSPTHGQFFSSESSQGQLVFL